MRNAGRALSVVVMMLAVTQGTIAAAADTGEWAGTWLSEAEGITIETTLMPDGRFRSEYMAGIRVLGITSGRWELQGQAIRWTYDEGPQGGLPANDVNSIVLKTAERFIVRELNGSDSVYYRKGTFDSLAPADLPVAVGTGWVLKDRLGEFAIRISAREVVGGHDCYRVDWIQGPQTYQSEYWFMDSEGIRVAGRRALGVKMEYSTPYLLLKRVLTRGDTWDASMTVQGNELKVTVSVGQRSEVITGAGAFQAVPVTLQNDSMRYVRWYAKDVGLVREDVLVGGEVLNTKTLERRIE
jgi:hypothetical protein